MPALDTPAEEEIVALQLLTPGIARQVSNQVFHLAGPGRSVSTEVMSASSRESSGSRACTVKRGPVKDTTAFGL